MNYLINVFGRVVCRQAWMRFGIRDRLARFIENPDTTPGVIFSQDFFGGRYDGSTDNFIDWSTRYFGAYSIAELHLFASFFPRPCREVVVLDIGANVGHHTLFYGLMGASGIAFEPNQPSASLVREKLITNQLAGWQVVEVALSDHSGEMQLSLPDSNNLGSASLEYNVGSRSVHVPVVRGDNCPSIQALSSIDYVKIDVEGHELSVLLGLKHTLRLHRPIIFFEWNDNAPFSDVYSAFPEGYRFWSFHSDQPRAFFLNSHSYTLRPLPIEGPARVANLVATP
jgi:FkbM family methyltransferase